MYTAQNPEVLIAGAGPVGLFTALGLADRGIPVRIVDTGVWGCAHSYALALHASTLQLLDAIGIGPEIRAAGEAIDSIGLYDRFGLRTHTHLKSEEMPVVLRQEMLEQLLESALNARGVQVMWRHGIFDVRQNGNHVTASVDKYEKETRGYVVARSEWVVAKTMEWDVPFVIGADGYNSVVRRSLDIPFPEVAPAEYYAVFEFQTDASLGREMRLMLDERTTDVVWPLPDNYCRWSFQLPDHADSEDEKWSTYRRTYGFPSIRTKDRLQTAHTTAPELGLDRLREFLRERAPWFEGPVEAVAWQTVVRFERRVAQQFGRGRMWLAGDAAHLTGPIGVQSLNMGLAEAADLVKRIAGVLRQGEPVESLQTHGQRWSKEWNSMMSGRVVAGDGTDKWAAAFADRLAACIPAHGEAFDSVVERMGFHSALELASGHAQG